MLSNAGGCGQIVINPKSRRCTMHVSQAIVISLIYHGLNSKRASSKLEEKIAIVSLQLENEVPKAQGKRLSTHFLSCQKELERLRNRAKNLLSTLDQQSQINKGLGKEQEPIIRTSSARAILAKHIHRWIFA
jgi:hypothetical protein